MLLEFKFEDKCTFGVGTHVEGGGSEVSALCWGPSIQRANKLWLDGQSHEETKGEIDDCLAADSLIKRNDRR